MDDVYAIAGLIDDVYAIAGSPGPLPLPLPEEEEVVIGTCR